MSYTSIAPPFHGGDAGSNPARVAMTHLSKETASVKDPQYARTVPFRYPRSWTRALRLAIPDLFRGYKCRLLAPCT